MRDAPSKRSGQNRACTRAAWAALLEGPSTRHGLGCGPFCLVNRKVIAGKSKSRLGTHGAVGNPRHGELAKAMLVIECLVTMKQGGLCTRFGSNEEGGARPGGLGQPTSTAAWAPLRPAPATRSRRVHPVRESLQYAARL